MYLITLAWTCLAIGQLVPIPDPQASPLRPSSSPTTHSLWQAQPSSVAGSSAPARAKSASSATAPLRGQGLTPPELVAQLLALPAEGELTGRPIELLEALAGARDGRQQLQVTHAYWHLVRAMAEYRLCFDQLERLAGLEARRLDATTLETARSSAKASLAEAELAAVAAQHELAETAMLPTSEPLPLAADPPHVGSYRTNYAQIFSLRPPLPRAALADRLLPIRRRAIDARAAAVQAAEEAMSGASAAYRSGQIGVETVLWCVGQLAEQRRALIAAVCAYNDDIVDYAVMATGGTTDNQALVAMLIKPSREAPQPLAEPIQVDTADGGAPRLAPQERAEPAGLNQQVPTPAASPWQPAKSQSPSDPSENAAGTSSTPKQPTPAPAPARGGATDRKGPTLAPPQKPLPQHVPPRDSKPTVPTPAAGWHSDAREVNKPIEGEHDTTPAAPSGLYPALRGAAPAVQAKQLAAVLHWDRDLPPDAGEPVSLAQCLRMQWTGDRLAMIDAYWTARQRAAEYQLLAQQRELLDDLASVLMGRGASEAGAPRLRAARLATDAQQLDARVALIVAQFELARHAGRSPGADWLLPSTVPHSGDYQLNMEGQPRASAQSWAMRRMAVSVSRLAEDVQDRAHTVVAADVARAEALESFQSGAGMLDRVLAGALRQTGQSMAFLQTLSDYNRAIAEYTLAMLPSAVPSDKLIETLALAP